MFVVQVKLSLSKVNTKEHYLEHVKFQTLKENLHQKFEG